MAAASSKQERAFSMAAWNEQLVRFRLCNAVSVVLFVTSMYYFLAHWDSALNRMNVFKLALPGLGVVSLGDLTLQFF
jgi:hypothetical protein